MLTSSSSSSSTRRRSGSGPLSLGVVMLGLLSVLLFMSTCVQSVSGETRAGPSAAFVIVRSLLLRLTMTNHFCCIALLLHRFE